MIRDFLLHGSNLALCLMAVCVLAAAAAGGPRIMPLYLVLGALLFYVNEYSTHRFLFHARPSRNDWLRTKQHRLHYDHHVEPSRMDLLFLPLWFLAPIMLLVALVAYALSASWALALSLELGISLAILHYEWVHFIAHQDYTPKTPWGRWMKRYHLRHHFVNEQLWFGVSNPSMDFVYGTYRDPAEVTRSRTTKILYPGQQDK